MEDYHLPSQATETGISLKLKYPLLKTEWCTLDERGSAKWHLCWILVFIMRSNMAVKTESKQQSGLLIISLFLRQIQNSKAYIYVSVLSSSTNACPMVTDQHRHRKQHGGIAPRVHRNHKHRWNFDSIYTRIFTILPWRQKVVAMLQFIMIWWCHNLVDSSPYLHQ